MSGSSAVGSSSAGAGRTLHAFFPDWNQVTGNVGTSGGSRVQPNNTNANVTQTVTQGAPPAQATGDYKGRRCWQLSSAVGGASVALWFAHRLTFHLDPVKYPPGLDDIAVIETRWLLALDRTAQDINDLHDLGVGLSPGGNNQNMNNPAVGAVYRAGVQFGPAGSGKVRFRSRVGQSGVGPPAYAASFDTTNIAPPGIANFDEREWHWYAIRFVSGQAGGVCKALVDGQLVAQFSATVAAGIFPLSNAGIGGAFGFFAGVTNATQGLVDKLYVARGLLLSAPDESSI